MVQCVSRLASGFVLRANCLPPVRRPDIHIRRQIGCVSLTSLRRNDQPSLRVVSPLLDPVRCSYPSKFKRAGELVGRSFSSDVEQANCKDCQASDARWPAKVIKDALVAANSYHEFERFTGCPVLKKDRFKQHRNCLLSLKISRMANAIIKTEGIKSVIYHHEESSFPILSAFLKIEGLSKDSVDLTGDGGKLALEVLKRHELTDFSFVVDIGGQDATFVEAFPGAKRLILDINTLTPFLSKIPGVQYGIGDVKDVIGPVMPKFQEDRRGKTLFAMSNFLNVLHPNTGWDKIKIVADHMKIDDVLIITNLDVDHFPEKNSNMYTIAVKDRGITQIVNHGGHFKSVIDDHFKLCVEKEIPSLKYVCDEVNKRKKISIRGDKKQFPVTFRTVLFVFKKEQVEKTS